MQHPFPILKPEYTHLLAAMQVRPECRTDIDRVAAKLLTYKTRYQPVSDKDGVPVVFIAACFEREASSDFSRNAATGYWNTAGAITGFQFQFSSGNITSGTIDIYARL